MKKIIFTLALFMFAAIGTTNAQEDFEAFLQELFDTVDSNIEDEVYEDIDAGQGDELEIAVEWMYNNNLTKFNNVSDYEPSGKLKREQAAKFFGVYASEFLGIQESSSYDCSFSDQADGHPGLWPNVIEACRLGLFKGADGAYLPTRTLTNAQAMTVLIKAVDGGTPEILTEGHWALPFYYRAKNVGLLAGLPAYNSDNLDDHITRGDAAIMMYRSREMK